MLTPSNQCLLEWWHDPNFLSSVKLRPSSLEVRGQPRFLSMKQRMDSHLEMIGKPGALLESSREAWCSSPVEMDMSGNVLKLPQSQDLLRLSRGRVGFS